MRCLKQMIKKGIAFGVILSTIVPLILPVSEIHAEDNRYYDFSIGVKTGNVKYGGTDGDVFAYLYKYDDAINGVITPCAQINLDSDADDHEKGDYRRYTIRFPNDPWMFRDIRINHQGGDGWYLEYLDLFIPQWWGQEKKVTKTVQQWLDSDDDTWDVTWGEQSLQLETKRLIDYDSIRIAMNGNIGGGEVFFSKSEAEIGTPSNWDALKKIPITITDQYDTYNPYTRSDPPVNPIIPHIDGIYSKTTDVNQISNYDYLLYQDDKNTEFGFVPNYRKLWETMDANHRDTATFNFEWLFPKRSTGNWDNSFSITLKRKVFHMKDINISYSTTEDITTAEGHVTGHYFNNSKKDVVIKARITNNVGVSNEKLVDYFKGTASLRRGNSLNGNKICDLKIEKDPTDRTGSTIQFTGTVEDYLTTESDGVSLVLQNVESGTSSTTSDYVLALDAYQSDLVQDTNDSKNFYHYFSDYKVDTISPEFRVVDENNTNKDISNHWAQSQEFYITSSEAMTEGKATYQLFDKQNNPVEITNYSGNGGNSAGGQEIPVDSNVINNALIHLKLTQPIEGIYAMKVDGKDIAKNWNSQTIQDIKLDNKPPTVDVSIIPQEQAVDGTKRIDYQFSIQDLSGTGKVYYCFAEEGQSIPHRGNIQKNPAESTQGQWYFIEQGAASTTAVLKVDKGKSFEGKLYYYTTDAQGNDSYAVNNQYGSKDIALYNDEANGSIDIEDMTPGLPSYQITFSDSSGDNQLCYRWIEKNQINSGFEQADYKTYAAGDNIGAAIHKGDDGKEYTFDGTYQLDYKIVNVNSGNTIKPSNPVYFVFDNSNPTIDLPEWSDGKKVRKTKQATITIEDKSKIVSARCTIVDINNTPISGYDPIPLPIENNGSVHAIIAMPETLVTGIYGVQIYAKDQNENEKTVAYNDSSGTDGKIDLRDPSYYQNIAMRFAVRTKKPELSLTPSKEKAIDGPIYNAYKDYYMTGQKDCEYTIHLYTQENINYGMNDNLNTFLAYVKYQTSSDGITWSEWKDAGSVTTLLDGGYHYTNIDISNPYSLVEGENKFYIRAAFYNTNTAQEPSEQEEELKRTPDEDLISDPVGVTIYLDQSDPEYTLAYDITERTKQNVTATLCIDNPLNKTYTVTENSPFLQINQISNEEYQLTITENVNATLRITDHLSHTTDVSINVDYIDREAPVAKTISNQVIESGDRKDAIVSAAVYGTEMGSTQFAIFKHGEALDEEDFSQFEQWKAEGKIKVNTISSETDYGEYNNTYTIAIRGLEGDYSLGYKSNDTLGNVITSVLPQSTIRLKDAELQLKEVNFDPLITKSNTVGTLSFNVPVVILPESRVTNDVESNLQEARVYGQLTNTKFTTQHKYVYKDGAERIYYVCDEAGRSKQVRFTMKDVQFIEGFEKNEEYRLNGNPITVNDGNWIGIEKNGDLKVYITPNKNYSRQYFYSLQEDGTEDMIINEDLSIIAENPPEEVTKAVYESVYGSASRTVSASVYGSVYSTSPIYTQIVFDVLTNGDSIKQGKFGSYTMEGVLEERAQAESIMIKQVDESAPNIQWRLSNVTPTNQPVTVYICFGDEESGIYKVEEKHEQGNYTLVDPSEYGGTNQITRTIHNKDEILVFRVTNRAGKVTEVTDIRASNIDITPIQEGMDYRVQYTYEDNTGEWIPITDGQYYRFIKATIISIEESKKNIAIQNNNHSFDKILVDSTPFTFEIVDEAGNKTFRTVEYTHYDQVPPVISHSIAPKSKTNQPVIVTIQAEDMLNRIARCEFYYKKDNALEKKEINQVREGVFSATAEASGRYVIYVWDAVGNKGIKNMEISNIDTSPVEIRKIKYSTPPTRLTSQTVLVTIESFNKSDVTILQVEPVAGSALTKKDIVYAMGSKSIRFKKNGSVGVSFMDAYGNTGQYIITVDNIKTTPPQCVGEFTLAQDRTYATISFDSIISDSGHPIERDLSQIFVSSGFMNSASIVTADKAQIVVKDNGTYDFTLADEVGNAQSISVTVTGIDKEPPKVTGVKWKYDYQKENLETGKWESKNEAGQDNAPSEKGYILSPEVVPGTNQDVEVTVITDKEISQIGSFDNTPCKETTVKYSGNGIFSFNLEAINDTSVLYGVDVELIDKEKPVIQFENTDELIFIEGDTRPNSAYDESKLYDFTAYDMRDGQQVEIPKEKVKIDFGRFNPKDINQNEFNRSKPYYVTYKVVDGVGNTTEITRTVRLIGLTDTLALINGNMPNVNSIAVVNEDHFTVSLKNHNGKTYVKYMPGMYTMGEMKYLGKVVQQNTDGTFTIQVSSKGWYTVSVQTDRKDFFNIFIYVNPTVKE